MSYWYLFLDGLESGPLTTEEFISHLQGKDPSTVYVWREGLDGWTLASDLPTIAKYSDHLKKPELIAIPMVPHAKMANPISRKMSWGSVGILLGLLICGTDLLFEWRGKKFEPWHGNGITANLGYVLGFVGALGILGLLTGAVRELFDLNRDADAILARDKKTKFNNFIARHWRGEYPLWVSYWVIGFCGNIVVGLIPSTASVLLTSDNNYYPPAIFAALTISWLGVLLVGAWQLVGVWRSANKSIEEKSKLHKRAVWAGLAQVAVVLGMAKLLFSFLGQGIPQISEAYQVSFRDDPNLPAYSIRVMRDGTEAEIVGGFKYGLTDDFEKILKASRTIRVVHLDSLGGRLGEGEKLNRLIKARGLDTYVSSKCMSACTLAFAAGRQRHLNKRAQLGFHRGAFPGSVEGEFDEAQRRVFAAAGFDSDFIRTALSTPHRDMWIPSAAVLLKAGVVTSIVDGDKFAISGYGESSREEMGRKIVATISMFGALKKRFPKEFDGAIDEFYNAIIMGKTESEAIQLTREKLLPTFISLIPLADDDVLVDFTRLLVSQYRALNNADSTQCYGYASGKSKIDATLIFARQLVDLELKIQERAINTARRRDKIEPLQLENLQAKLQTRLLARGVSVKQLELLDLESVPKSRHKEYCEIAIALFEEVTKFPQSDAANFMRSALTQ